MAAMSNTDDTPATVTSVESSAAADVSSHVPGTAASEIAAWLARFDEHGSPLSTELAGPGL
jgi:hypothetical protein